ncbi:MAG: LPS-assembly protein LptD [bacterium]|nr:LPS-assembly protein LptD [bacterium]
MRTKLKRGNGTCRLPALVTALIMVGLFLMPTPTRLDGASHNNNNKKRSEIKILSAGSSVISRDTISYTEVEVIFETYRIYADTVTFNKKTGNLTAQGRVTMTSEETVLSGEKLLFNLDSKSGELYETYGQISPTTRYTTKHLKQVDHDTLTFNKLDLTACAQCKPRWRISCSNGRIKKEKYIEMKNVVFKIKNFPVFYLPYFRYPIKKDARVSGFLMPRIGYSTLKKFFIKNGVFLRISPNCDLTLNCDYYAQTGYGFSEEFRYLFRHMAGNFKFFAFNYIPGNELKPDTEWDYFMEVKHNQKIRFLNTSIIVDISRQSDPKFLSQFSNDFISVLRLTSKSYMAVTSSIGNLKLSVSGKLEDTYYTQKEKTKRDRYLPAIDMRLGQQKVWKLPGYFSFRSSYCIYRKDGISYEEGEENIVPGVTSSRLSFTPAYSLNLVKLPFLKASMTLKSKHSLYFRSMKPAEIKGEEDVVTDKNMHMHFQTADLVLTGPSVSRLFKFTLSKLKHIIFSKIVFRYATKPDEEDRTRLIKIDTFDRPSYSYLSFSLSTRLLFKKKKKGENSPLDVLVYGISQEYYFDPRIAHNYLTVKLPVPGVDADGNQLTKGIYPEFSQLKHTLRLRPGKHFACDGSLIYNHYLKQFTKLSFSVKYLKADAVINGSFRYNKKVNQFQHPNWDFNTETVGAALAIAPRAFPLKLRSVLNFDINNSQLRNGSVQLDLDYQCVTLKGEVRFIQREEKLDTQFIIGFKLGNLGMVKDFI